MKILGVADPHGSRRAFREIDKKSKEADIILMAGDITVFGHDMARLLREMDSWNRPVLLIPGNHESPDLLERMSRKHKNLIYFDEKSYEIGNYFFLGIEGNGFAHVDKHFEGFAKKFIPIIKRKRREFHLKGIDFRLILMTHAPPYDTELDKLIGGEHCGNRSIRDFIRKMKPDLSIAGHIHECNDKEDRIAGVPVVNPGPEGRIFVI